RFIHDQDTRRCGLLGRWHGAGGYWCRLGLSKPKIGLCLPGEDGQNGPTHARKDKGMSLQNLRHLAEYFAVRVALSLIQAVRIETCEAVCRWLAWLAADVLRIRGRVVEENLQIAFPEKTAAERNQITRRMWEHLLLMVCETAQLQPKF